MTELEEALDTMRRYSIGLEETWLSGSNSVEYFKEEENHFEVSRDIDYTEEAIREISESIVKIKDLLNLNEK